MTGTGVTGSDCEQFGNASERRRELWVNLGASGSAGDKPGSADDKPGSTSNHSRAVWEKHRLWERCWCAWKS